MRDQCSLELNPNRGVKLSVNQIKTMWLFKIYFEDDFFSLHYLGI